VFQRQKSGSVVCPSCGSLVGINDERCYSCGRARPGMWGFAPLFRRLGSDMGFVPFVIGASTLLYLLTLLASGSDITVFSGVFNIMAPSGRAMVLFGASGALPVFSEGAWWTILSATWLHGSFLHILFNMMWVRDLGPSTAQIIGPARTIIIYVVAGACGFLFSSFAGAYLSIPFLSGAFGITIGASASIFGLLGALVHYGRVSGSTLIRGEAMRFAIILFVMGLFLAGVDNAAHAGGFVGGYATSAFFNPLAREKGDHMVVAIALLAATFLAILFSIYHFLPLYYGS
jgi:rhomboid protease GluP